MLSCALQAQLRFSQRDIDLGRLGQVNEVQGGLIVRNDGEEKIHFLKVNGDPGMSVHISKRTMQPGDTALLILVYRPEESGRFHKTVQVITSEERGTYDLSLSGQLEAMADNSRTACYYFGSGPRRHVKTKTGPIYAQQPYDSNLEREPPSELTSIEHPRVTQPIHLRMRQPETASTKTNAPVARKPGLLTDHKPNNILLLVDISSSMRDSMKLPLAKKALHQLVDAIRDIDTITLVTYADTVRIRAEALSSSDRSALHKTIESLKARGMTKGKTALLYCQSLAQKHYLQNGNNLMMIATDGEFRFTTSDRDLWNQRQSKGKITLTTIAFGQDKKALQSLKQIAQAGEGSFIHVSESSGAQQALTKEVEMRSRPLTQKR